MEKKPFDIDDMMVRIQEAVKPFRKAAMFELYDDGFTTPFEQLVACMISIRTLDETSVPVARKLFARARTPAEMSRLTAGEIDQQIHASTFHQRKAEQILALARRVEQEYRGDLPCDGEIMMSFSGVGLKCANLVLGIACGKPRVSADIHVHRVTNRWGYVHTQRPEQTSQALEEKLPKKYWVEINRLLVPFGKHICTGNLPHCSICPVLEYCRQVGVERHR